MFRVWIKIEEYEHGDTYEGNIEVRKIADKLTTIEEARKFVSENTPAQFNG